MDIICVDGQFPQDQLDFYSKYGVVVPEQEKLYTVRDVIINSSGENGFLLEEIVNPSIPIKHPVLGIAEMEPNWKINRFRTLSGDILNAMEISRTLKEIKCNIY